MNVFRFVIVGCGRMGLAHTTRLASHPEAQLAGFFDPITAAAEELRDRFAPAALVAESFDELLQLEADAVVIGTPTTLHREQVEAAAARGWHVLCEKPLAEHRDGISALCETAARRNDLHFQLGYQRRFWTPYGRLKSEIESGRHGAVRAVTSFNAERWQQTIAGTWRDDPGINFGGFLGDAGSHKLDILLHVTGLTVEWVFATSDSAGSRVEITSSVTGRFCNGALLTLSLTGHASSFSEELFVHCERADLILRDGELWIGRENQQTQIVTPPAEYGPESTRNPVSGFLELLSGRSGNLAPFEAAGPVFDLTAAILESSLTRQPVEPGVARSR